MASQIQSNCEKCGMCLPACPTGSVYRADVQFLIDSDTCLDCLHCVEVCPTQAITNPKVKPKDRKKA